MSDLDRSLGRVEKAVESLDKSVTGFRADVKTLTEVISAHHDRLKDGDYRFKEQDTKLKVLARVVIGWLIILTVMDFPGLLPWARALMGKIF